MRGSFAAGGRNYVVKSSAKNANFLTNFASTERAQFEGSATVITGAVATGAKYSLAASFIADFALKRALIGRFGSYF